MNRKNTIKYIHPVVGEVYLDKNTKAFELFQEKDFKKLDEVIATEFKKCYNDLVPVIQR